MITSFHEGFQSVSTKHESSEATYSSGFSHPVNVRRESTMGYAEVKLFSQFRFTLPFSLLAINFNFETSCVRGRKRRICSPLVALACTALRCCQSSVDFVPARCTSFHDHTGPQAPLSIKLCLPSRGFFRRRTSGTALVRARFSRTIDLLLWCHQLDHFQTALVLFLLFLFVAFRRCS